MRLNKFIAESGFCSRRKADELILEGRVSVNRHEAILGMDITDADTVRVDGERIKINTKFEYYMLNKPKRVLCSSEDKFGRKLAVDFIKTKRRLFTYGRLDFMTEGLIIISNDGEIYNHVMHPRKKLYKSYIAKVNRDIEEKDIEALTHGVVIEGKRTAPSKVKKIDKKEKLKNKKPLNIVFLKTSSRSFIDTGKLSKLIKIIGSNICTKRGRLILDMKIAYNASGKTTKK